MVLTLLGVLDDGSEPPGTLPPLEPHRQDVEVPRGEDVLIHLQVLARDGSAANLTGVLAMALILRRYRDDATPAAVKAATAVDLAAGLMDIAVDSADTVALFEQTTCFFDVVYQDSEGAHWQLLPVSHWRVQRIVSTP